MQNDAYQIKLENIFEGPMDLLVHLIKKNEVDIYDIPISLITDQFLSYIEWMQSMNIDVAADFLVMASTLTHIKSRMLLPSPASEAEESEDPRAEITGPLLEYLRMKSAAAKLSERLVLNEDVFVRPPARAAEYLPAPEEMLVRVDLYELIQAYVALMDRMAPDIRIEITPERISVKDRMTRLIDILAENGTVTFAELVSTAADRSEIIVTFLAILEVVRLNMARLNQTENNGGIRLYGL